MIGFVGLQVQMLFFLDEFGPITGYVLKVGLIAAGIWVWRKDDSAAVEEDTPAEGSKRAWIPVIVSGALILGIIGFITVSQIRNRHLENQLTRTAAPAIWAAGPTMNWPDVVLLQKASFAHHTSMKTGCAALVRLPTGEIAALTAGHLLGKGFGVTPGFVRGGLGGLDQEKLATLTTEITSWNLYLPDAMEQTAKVTGLYGEARQFDEQCDQVLLRLAPGISEYPATPLDVRLTPVTFNEPLHVITYERERGGEMRQVVYNAKRVPGPVFTCILEFPEELTGSSGAPVVDKDGLLVGIVTGGTMMDYNNPTSYSRAFSGHLISELMPVLKSAIAQKGVAPLTPVKAVFRPIHDKSTVDKPATAPADAI